MGLHEYGGSHEYSANNEVVFTGCTSFIRAMYTFPNFEVENMAVQLIGAPDQNCRLRTMGFHLQVIRILLWILIPTL